MSVTEAQRHHLFELVKSHYDDEAAETLMQLLPPVGWGDVATKHDIARLEQRLDRVDQRFDRVDQRFDRVEERLDTLDVRVAGLQSSFVGWLLASQATVVAIIGAATAVLIAVLG